MSNTITPACIVSMKKMHHGFSHKLCYETPEISSLAKVLTPPTGDGVFTGDHSPQIGTFKWNKPIGVDGKMHVTYALFLQQGQTFVDIPNTHNVFTAVNMAFTIWELFGNIKFDRVPYMPNTPIDVQLAIVKDDPRFVPAPGQTISPTIAYTYYPPPPSGIFTSVYNPAYLWSLDGRFNFSYNLNEILRHELGHSWGAVHTTNPSDIMYPFYHNSLKPTLMDIYQIQYCYGARTHAINPVELDAIFAADIGLEEFRIDPMP